MYFFRFIRLPYGVSVQYLATYYHVLKNYKSRTLVTTVHTYKRIKYKICDLHPPSSRVHNAVALLSNHCLQTQCDYKRNVRTYEIYVQNKCILHEFLISGRNLKFKRVKDFDVINRGSRKIDKIQTIREYLELAILSSDKNKFKALNLLRDSEIFHFKSWRNKSYKKTCNSVESSNRSVNHIELAIENYQDIIPINSNRMKDIQKKISILHRSFENNRNVL